MKILSLLMTLSLLVGCVSFNPERLEYASIKIDRENDPASHEMQYGVYTPPNWQRGESLDIILFLHGGGGSHESIERYGAAEYLDEKINAGEIPRVIIVTPDGGNGFWENWQDGSFQYRDWVLKDVFPQVQKDYQTLDCPEHCHLAGISMGGFGALRMAYLHRDTFASVSSMSAPIYSDQQANEQSSSWLAKLFFPLERIFGNDNKTTYRRDNPYNAWIDDEQQQTMRLQLIWGDQDRKQIRVANEIFHQRLIQSDVAHDHHVYVGKHKWKDWIPNLERVINFLVLSPNE